MHGTGLTAFFVLAYALAWLDLARTVAATKTRRLRIAGGLRLLRGRS